MKILMSADWFYPAQMGGPSNAIYWQAKALTRAGHDVRVVATSQDLPSSIPLNCWLTLDCGRVMYTRNPHFYWPLVHIWYAARTMRGVDVVHINSLFYPSSFVLVFIALLLNKLVVWSPHGELNSQALAYSPRRKRLILRILKRMSHQVVFHATCPAEATCIRQHFGPDVAVEEVRTMMELPEVVERIARPYLLFIGRLHPIKAIDRLLDALGTSTLFRASQYTMTIAGPDDSGYRQILAKQVQCLGLVDKVNFVGPVQGAYKEQLYADARLTILPSQSENFGLVVIESLAQGTPVVASTGTPWSQLETEQAGSWVSNDPDNLRQTIETYLTMPAEAYQLYRTRAAEFARREFDIMRNVSEWERFYETLRPTTTLSITSQPV